MIIKIVRSIFFLILLLQLSGCITYMYLNKTDDYKCQKVSLDTIKSVYITTDSFIVFNVYGNCRKLDKKDHYNYAYNFIDNNLLNAMPIYKSGRQYHKIEKPLNVFFQEEGKSEKIKAENKSINMELTRSIGFIVDSAERIDSIPTILMRHIEDIKNKNDFALILKLNGNFDFYYILYDNQKNCYLSCHIGYVQPICFMKRKWKLPCCILADIVLLPVTIPIGIIVLIVES
jgi:hypothetical protein